MLYFSSIISGIILGFLGDAQNFEFSSIMYLTLELLHHGTRAGEGENSEIRVVSGETNLITLKCKSQCKPKC